MKNMCILTILTVITLSFAACGSNDRHDWNEGYEAGWEGAKAPTSFFNSKAMKDGYEQGLYDADAYYEGYYDGKNSNNPKYIKDTFYMDGFKDGKKNKRY